MNVPFILQQAGLSATPLLVAGIGELVAERAGLINVGIEGTMLMGAVAAYSGAVLTGSAWAGIPAAIGVGMVFAAIFALAAVWFRADQIVTGTALNILALGSSTTLARLLQQYGETHPLTTEAPHFDRLSVSFLGPFNDVFSQFPLFYLAVLALPALYLLMKQSRLGLIIRALGDAPDSANAAGIRVRLARTGILLFAGALSGIAGAYLSTMRNHSFQLNMTSGQGFLVLALVIFGRWNILTFAAGVAAFSMLNGLQSYLTTTSTTVPRQLFDMLPYAATLGALAVLSRSSAGPLALGRAWPEER